MNGLESIGLEGFDFGVVVEFDGVDAELGVELVGVGEVELVDGLLELGAEHLAFVLYEGEGVEVLLVLGVVFAGPVEVEFFELEGIVFGECLELRLEENDPLVELGEVFFSGLYLEGEVFVGSVERGGFKSKLLYLLSEFMLLPEHELNAFLLGDSLLMQVQIVVVLFGCQVL